MSEPSAPAQAPEPTDIARQRSELDALSQATLEACRKMVRAPSPERLKAWLAANAAFMAAHRAWWATLDPELDYDALYGGAPDSALTPADR